VVLCLNIVLCVIATVANAKEETAVVI